MKNKVFTNWIGIKAGFDPVGLAGFVYLVVNTLTSKKYIGKKNFWFKNRKKVPGRKRRKLVVKESDWRYYKSSSEDLKKDIAIHGLEAFEFRILQTFKTKTEMNYAEVREQFVRDVLHSRLNSKEFEYYNSNILGKYFRGRV